MLNISSLIDLYLLLVPPPPPPPIGSGGRENAMIEMERIQNMNLGEGKEADGKVEDDRADGERERRGFTSNINQNCEWASLARLLALELAQPSKEENTRRARHLSGFRRNRRGSRLQHPRDVDILSGLYDN